MRCVHDWQQRPGPGLVCLRCSECRAVVALRGVLKSGHVWVQVVDHGRVGVTEQELLAVVRWVTTPANEHPPAQHERCFGEA